MPNRRSLWDVLTRRDVHSDTASDLYGRLVTAARAPTFYAALGTPDTPEGRLEVLVLHVVLMLRRLAREGAAANGLSRALSEAFVTDMDDCLREMGVGDISVAKKVKQAAAALFDRHREYGAALDSANTDALALSLAAHVLATPAPSHEAARLAAFVKAAEESLTQTPLTDLTSQSFAFPGLPL